MRLWQRNAVGVFSLAGTGKLVIDCGKMDGAAYMANLGEQLQTVEVLGRRFPSQQENMKHSASASIVRSTSKHIQALE